MKVKGKPFVVMGLTIVLFSLFTGAISGQEIFQFLTHNITLEVLPKSIFEARFGDNPDVPRTEKNIIALARKLYPPLGTLRTKAAGPAQECREYEVGVLFAALQNPAVSDWTRRQVDYIIEAAIPPLPKTYTYGHFKFYYTTNNADSRHNVTLEDIQITAEWLNRAWKVYAARFKPPKYYVSGGERMVDVRVYYLGDNLYGNTNSHWKYINLNSKLTVRNRCKRRTVSAHELFHRVQYRYGYVSGTARMKWIVEGTAAWSQKFTSAGLRDYTQRMNQGLKTPDRDLIGSRSYDACHFWVYLEQSAGTWEIIRDTWAAYESNGHKANNAVNTATLNRLGIPAGKFAQNWIKANYIKDLVNAGAYDYDEDELPAVTKCGKTYGPLSRVPRTTTEEMSFNDAGVKLNGSVQPNGADYYEFPLGPNLTQLQVKVTGAAPGNFSYHFISVKNHRVKGILSKTVSTYTLNKTLTPGQWDKLALVVAGGSTGGDYSVTVGSPLSGHWVDMDGATWWTLKQEGHVITGTMVESPDYCGTMPVTGIFFTPDITLFVDKVNASCCAFTFNGRVRSVGANGEVTSFIGTLARTGTYTSGGVEKPCTGDFQLILTKQDANALTKMSGESKEPPCRECEQ